MIDPVRLAVLELFGSQSARWRRPIEAAAIAQGWSYHEYWGGEPPVLDPERSSVIVCADPTLTGLEQVEWFVLSSPPQEVLSELERHGLEHAEALHHASRRLAQASGLVQKGAGVASAYGASLTLPGLGEIAVAEGSTGPTPAGTGELAFYDHLPPAPGVTFVIPTEAMNFPIYRTTDDGSPRINLLGRRRIIFNGPMYVLPPGQWILRARLNIDCDQVHLLFGWGFEVALEKLEHRDLGEGVYEIELRNRWPEIGTADFSCALMTPVLEGDITVDWVSVTYDGTA